MTRTAAQLHWLAGLMEGEGCFGSFTNGRGAKRYLRIMLNMCDRDVVERAHALLGGQLYVRAKKRSPRHNTSYCVQLTGDARVAGWMMTLYPLLGNRRQGKIKQLLTEWRLSSLL